MNTYVKITKFSLIILVFITVIICKNPYCYAKENIKEVDSQKKWVIKFSQLIDPKSVSKENILVKDSNNNILEGIDVSLLEDGQTIKVKAPQEGYRFDDRYSLIITSNICSLKGKNLKDIKTINFKVKKTIEYEKIPIMGKSDLSADKIAEYVLKYNSNPKLSVDVHELAKLFLEEGAIEGVRGDIAFCQSIKETGFFKYGGQVLPEQNNYAGIGAINNSPVGKGAWFKDPKEGVRAQIQHLKAYATNENLKNSCVDPRYCIIKDIGKLGIAPNWEDLNGNWAVPGNNYGQEIINIYKKIKFLN